MFHRYQNTDTNTKMERYTITDTGMSFYTDSDTNAGIELNTNADTDTRRIPEDCHQKNPQSRKYPIYCTESNDYFLEEIFNC